MNKYLLLLILPFLSFGMVSCDDDEDVTPIDIPLIAGTWEVVDQGNQNVFEREFILNITSSQIHEGYGGYKGYINTYFLKYDGTPIHNQTYGLSYVVASKHQG